MSESQPLWPWVAEQLQSSAEEVIKRPVKEAVREVLAETNQMGDEGIESETAASRHIEVDPADDDESTSSVADATQTESRSRLRSQLRSHRALVLGLIALGAYLGRRRFSTRDD